MAVQLYLYATKCSAQMAMSRYMATDAPGNAEARADQIASQDRANQYLAQRAEFMGYWNDRSRRERELGDSSWGWANITRWRDTAITTAQKVASIPARMQGLLASDGSTPVAFQWVVAQDVELASRWLRRAMKYTPDDIAAMEPIPQHQAIVDMWAAYANYWKAINVSPQAWGKYREAWISATMIGAVIWLNGPGGVMPRPCATFCPTPYWARLRVTRGRPLVDSAPLPPSFSWQGVEARALVNYSNTALGSPKPGLSPYVYMGWGGSGWMGLWFGSGAETQPTGNGPFGQPTSLTAPSQWPKNVCQEDVTWGGSCFAPMGGSHQVWIDANGFLTGGMASIAPGQIGQWVMVNAEAQADSPLYLDAAAFRSTPRAVSGYGRSVSGTVTQNWLTARMNYRTDSDGGNREWNYSPPAKRYVDLLWPLLEYLSSMSVQDVSLEVMLDVMGKNAFARYVSGMNEGQIQSALQQGIAAERQAYVRQATLEQAKTNFVQSIVTALAGIIPVVGGSAAAGLGTLFAGVNAATPLPVPSDNWGSSSYDVFGRMDALRYGQSLAPTPVGTSSRQGATVTWGPADPAGLPPMSLGMIERYVIAEASPSQLTRAQGDIYESIRVLSKTSDGPVGASPSFVASGSVPWPVGDEAPEPARGESRSRPRPQGGIRRPHGTVRLPGGGILTRLEEPETVLPVVTASTGVSPVALVVAGCLAGAAGGLTLAGRGRPRQNPPRARRGSR